jgi:hypothetical protein
MFLGWGEITKMKRFLAVAIVLLTVNSIVWAQTTTFRVKHTPTDKAPRKSSVPVKTTGPTSAAGANAKDLSNLEHQTARTETSRQTGTRPPAIRPVKDKPNPPINFNGSPEGHAGGGNVLHQGSNPYKGRLKQKYSHQ